MTNRQQILEAALDVFTEKGVAAADLDQIAEKAGCETASIRALFVDSPALLRELLEDISTPLLGVISMAVEKQDHPREMLKESLLLFDRWLLDNPKYTRLVQRCAVDDPKALSIVFQKSMYPSEFYEWLDAWTKEGKIKAVDTFSLMLILHSMILLPHFTMATLSESIPLPPEEILRRRFDTMWNALEQGLFTD